jgi:hypothetical protein
VDAAGSADVEAVGCEEGSDEYTGSVESGVVEEFTMAEDMLFADEAAYDVVAAVAELVPLVIPDDFADVVVEPVVWPLVVEVVVAPVVIPVEVTTAVVALTIILVVDDGAVVVVLLVPPLPPYDAGVRAGGGPFLNGFGF